MRLDKYLFEIKDLLGIEDNRYIVHLIDTSRALYYRNKLLNGGAIPSQAIQILPTITMEMIDESTSPILIPSDYRILRSTERLPKLLTVRQNTFIFSVRNPRILARPFEVVNRDVAVYAGSGRCNERSVFCFLHDDYLYVKLQETNPRITFLTEVTAEGLFTSATEAITFTDKLAGRDIWFHEYPIDEESWIHIKQLIINGSVRGNATSEEEGKS